jgi:hypothetical protein
VRAALLVLVLAVLTLQTPPPWAWLWLAVPAALALSLLLCWRYGTVAVAVVAAGAVGLTVLGSTQGLWLWWIPAAVLVGAWMGVREEGGGPSTGQRAWMLAPVLAFAALLPWLAEYQTLLAGTLRSFAASEAQAPELLRQMGQFGQMLMKAADYSPASVHQRGEVLRGALPLALPTVLFLWVTLLVVLGRALAARVARALRWPRLSRVNLREWRLPDGVLWIFISGLALLLTPWPAWAPTGWTLMLNAGLGYCVQGVAVVESLLLARGVPPPVVVLTMTFAFLIFMPYFVLAAAALGLSDVWLDYRRLEPAPEGDQNQGDR